MTIMKLISFISVFLPQDLQDEPKLKALYTQAELHSGITEELMNRVRSGKHIYIHRKTNLLFLLKKEFQRTNSCDFSLGKLTFK